MLQPRDGFVSVNGLRLHYLQWGDERQQPLLLLHGGSAHAHWWDFFVTPFTAAYRVLALDLRGHGDSQWAEPPAYEIAAYAADVSGFIDTLALTNVVLAGHSLGGLVAVACAPLVQQRLAALVIMDVSARISQRTARYIACASPPWKSVRPQPRISRQSPVKAMLESSRTKLRQPSVWPGVARTSR